MPLVTNELNSIAKIKVVGVGGGGNNALNTMINQERIQGVEFICVNTDLQALLVSNAPTKLQIGEKVTRGLGSGANPDMGRQAAEESREKLREMLIDSDMVFIAAGMGGGTGTGAAPIVAEIAKETGALTVAVVTRPFKFEGQRRNVVADEGIDKLKEKVDTLIVIPNERIMEVIDQKTSFKDAFKVVDSVLAQGVASIADLIVTPGLINVDFADVKTIMNESGTALMGSGTARGDSRAIQAARSAVTSPLLETSIEGAKGILINIIGGDDMTMFEVNEAANFITQAADVDANIIVGASIRPGMSEEIKISVIATGFDESRRLFGQQYRRPNPEVEKQQTVYQPPQPVSQTLRPLSQIMGEDNDNQQENTWQRNNSPKNEEGFDTELDIPTWMRSKKN